MEETKKMSNIDDNIKLLNEKSDLLIKKAQELYNKIQERKEYLLKIQEIK